MTAKYHVRLIKILSVYPMNSFLEVGLVDNGVNSNFLNTRFIQIPLHSFWANLNLFPYSLNSFLNPAPHFPI